MSELTLAGDAEKARIDRPDRQDQGCNDEAAERQGGAGAHQGSACGTRMRALQPSQPAIAPGRAGGEEHRVGGGGVIFASLGGHEQADGDEEQPAQRTIAPPSHGPQIPPEAGDPQWQGERIAADHDLAKQEAVGPADAHVARVDAGEEAQRDEAVLRLPYQVGQPDQQRQARASPQPTAAQVPPRGGQQHGHCQREKVEGDGVPCHQAQPRRGPDGQPPARVFALEQADGAEGDQHPPKVVERDVLEERPLGHRQRRDAGRQRGHHLRPPPAAKLARHQAGQQHASGLGDAGQQAHSHGARPENGHFERGQEGCQAADRRRSPSRGGAPRQGWPARHGGSRTLRWSAHAAGRAPGLKAAGRRGH